MSVLTTTSSSMVLFVGRLFNHKSLLSCNLNNGEPTVEIITQLVYSLVQFVQFCYLLLHLVSLVGHKMQSRQVPGSMLFRVVVTQLRCNQTYNLHKNFTLSLDHGPVSRKYKCRALTSYQSNMKAYKSKTFLFHE